MNKLVLTAHEGPVTTLTLNRPARHNSLTPEFLSSIYRSVSNLPASTRVMVLQAKGRSFSTGGDLTGFQEYRHDLPRYAAQIVGRLNEVILAMIDLEIPVVTAVHGMVTGGSLGLILASDIVLVTPEASFTPYYPVVGFSPDGGWAAWLATIIGQRRAAESLFCNRTITAADAVAWGLATRLVNRQDLAAAVQETAGMISSMRSGSIKHSKQLLAANRHFIAEVLEQERQHFVQQIGTVEAEQGLEVFLARSKVSA